MVNMRPQFRFRSALAVLAVLLIIAAVYCASKPPAQARIALSFKSHRGEFEDMRKMMMEDGLTILGKDANSFCRASYGDADYLSMLPGIRVGLTDERILQYRALMRAAGVTEAFSHGSDFQATVASFGFLWHVDILWTAFPPKNMVQSIDDMRGVFGKATSHLEGNWYLGSSKLQVQE